MGFWPEYQGESKDLYHLKTIPGKPNSFLCCSSSMPTNLLSGSCLTREILFGARFILFLKVVMSSGMRMVRRDGMSLMWTGSDVNNRRGTTLKCQQGKEPRKTYQSSSLRQCHQTSFMLTAGTSVKHFSVLNIKHIFGIRGMIPRCGKLCSLKTCVPFPLYYA